MRIAASTILIQPSTLHTKHHIPTIPQPGFYTCSKKVNTGHGFVSVEISGGIQRILKAWYTGEVRYAFFPGSDKSWFRTAIFKIGQTLAKNGNAVVYHEMAYDENRDVLKREEMVQKLEYKIAETLGLEIRLPIASLLTERVEDSPPIILILLGLRFVQPDGPLNVFLQSILDSNRYRVLLSGTNRAFPQGRYVSCNIDSLHQCETRMKLN